jgi:hypothetical protein
VNPPCVLAPRWDTETLCCSLPAARAFYTFAARMRPARVPRKKSTSSSRRESPDLGINRPPCDLVNFY